MTELTYDTITAFMETKGYDFGYDTDEDVMDAIIEMTMDDKHFTDSELLKLLAAFRYAEFVVKYGKFLA